MFGCCVSTGARCLEVVVDLYHYLQEGDGIAFHHIDLNMKKYLHTAKIRTTTTFKQRAPVETQQPNVGSTRFRYRITPLDDPT